MNKMKCTMAVVCIFMLWILSGCAATGNGSVHTCSEIDSPYPLKQIAMFGNTIGWGLSLNNEVCYTERGISGLSVLKKIENIYPDSDGFVNAFFLNESTAYFSYFTFDGLYINVSYTMDAGKNWEDTQIPFQKYTQWGGCNTIYTSFADEKNGYVLYCSDPAAGIMEKLLFKTTDGGRSFIFWADISNTIDGYPSGISFSSAFDGIISTTYHGGKYSLYQTNDAGNSWKPMPLERYEKADVAGYTDAYAPVYFDKAGGGQGRMVLKFVGEQTVFEVYTTKDGGKSWKPEGILNCGDVFSIFSDNDRGYIVDNSGKLYMVKW